MGEFPLWINVSLILAAALLLWFSAQVVVDSAVSLAKRLGISELIVGLTVVAAGTSAPEFGVTLVAAFQGQNEISVGNIVGSNIFNIGFILGGAALLGTMRTGRQLVLRDASVLVVSSLIIFLLVGIDLSLDHWDGWILAALLVGYLTLIWKQRRRRTPVKLTTGASRQGFAIPLRETLRLLLGLASVAMASHLLIGGAQAVAREFGLSEWVIAVTIVAAGTSLPEMATMLAGVFRKHHAVGFGNLIGSDIFNLLGVLGLAGILEQMTLGPAARSSLLALLGMTVITLIFMRSGWRLSRWEGLALVALGAFRWYLDMLPPTLG
jgi:cation:H+ antiporter